MSDADSDVFNEFLIARWFDRFVAWLIDAIIIIAILGSITALTSDITTLVWNVDSTRSITNFEWDENSWLFGSSSPYLFFSPNILSAYYSN